MKIRVRVKPSARKREVTCLPGGTYKVSVTESPQDGRANEAVCGLLADYFHVRKNQVIIRMGAARRDKVIEVLGEIKET